MHQYDTVLKSLLTGSENSIFQRITGTSSGRWLNVELPDVTQTRVDLLFETIETASAPRRLIAMELQSTNDAMLPLRMAEYSLRVYRVHKQFPEQYVLYVGTDEMAMSNVLAGPNHVCRFNIIDIRKWSAQTLLRSPFAGDIVIAILGRYAERPETIRRILARIAKIGKGPELNAAFSRLMILAGIRKLGEAVRKEAQSMPILDDIMNHDVIGPAIRQGMAQGLERGIEQGLEQGLERGSKMGQQNEALAYTRRLLTSRFGTLPVMIEDRLSKLSTTELEDLGVRTISASNITDLFAKPK